MGVVFHFDGTYLDECDDLLKYLISCDLELWNILEDCNGDRGTHKSVERTTSTGGGAGLRSLDRQSSLFMTLVVETFTHSREDIKQISPSIYALQKCLDAGWIPTSYPTVYLPPRILYDKQP